MTRRARYRLQDILEAIRNIHDLLDGVEFDDMYASPSIKAAFERFLEIASEASRHLPESLTVQHPEVPWRQVADLGNVLRHTYHKADARTLWDIYEIQLDVLETAVKAMLANVDEEDD